MPCTPSILGVETLRATMDLVIPRAKSPPIVVLNAVAARGDRAKQADAAIKAMGLVVSPARITQRIAFEDAALAGRGVIEAFPDSPASLELQAFWTYVRELLYPYTGRRKAKGRGA